MTINYTLRTIYLGVFFQVIHSYAKWLQATTVFKNFGSAFGKFSEVIFIVLKTIGSSNLSQSSILLL